MSETTPFLSPHLVGKRFDGHSIPLEVLRDLSVFHDMILEVAKWHYLEDNPERKRSPRGFTEGVSLQLTDIGDGSAVANIALVVTSAAATLFPPENQQYYERARESIVAAIAAAEANASITDHLV
ncbi:MAG: hypothetical protein AB8G99_05965, partial [Planctomycetaceae bacterium]